MADETSPTLILGMGLISEMGATVPPEYKPPFEYHQILYHTLSMGNRGYHSISWKKSDTGIYVGESHYIRGGLNIEEQAGVILEELIQRDPKCWFWAKSPISLISGAAGFYIQQDLTATLKSLLNKDIFSGLTMCEELYDRPVLLGFGTVDAIEARRSQWYQPLQAATDILLQSYLIHDEDKETTKKYVGWLKFLHSTEKQAEQAALRWLLTHPLTDEQFSRAPRLMEGYYEKYDGYDRKTGKGSVRRTIDGKKIIIPDNKMFANPESIRKALDELRTRLIR